MKHFLLFDSGCSICTDLANDVERESGGILIARSLRDQEIQALLDQTSPGWTFEPMLLEVDQDRVKMSKGIAMRMRIFALLGPQRTYRVGKIMHQTGISILGLNMPRRAFLRQGVTILAGITLLGIPKYGITDPPLSRPNSAPPQPGDLKPGVWAFIANNYLSHAAEFPDSNETVEPLRAYLESDDLLREGNIDAAISLSRSTVVNHPESRHAHAGLGRALWQRYQQSSSEEDLRSAVNEFIAADKIGVKNSKVHYTYFVGIGLGRLKDLQRLDRYFETAINAGNSPYLSRLDYARGLTLADDSRAQKWYREAMVFSPKGLWDALAYYGEWLLDHNRNSDVIKLVNDKVDLFYAHFLKGVALERLNKKKRAKKEYAYYKQMSVDFPPPERFRIEGSESQKGVNFNYAVSPKSVLSTVAQAKADLSTVISGEAIGESVGGQRAVGWVARTRVFQAYVVPTACGGYPTGRWRALASTASLPDKYIAICDSSGQFTKGTASPSTDQQADGVYRGSVPDPVVGSCITGSNVGGICSGTCSPETTSGAFTHGGAWFYAVSPATMACPACHPVGCSCHTAAGGVKPCYNGGTSENCFYQIV